MIRKHVKLTTESGYTWNTTCNGTVKEIEDYFLGTYFNIGTYPIEKMDKVVKVNFI